MGRSHGPLPYRFMVDVSFDGNKVPELAKILPQESATSNFTGRWSHNDWGDLIEQPWVFTPLGIEILFSKMEVTTHSVKIPKDEADRGLQEIYNGMTRDMLNSENKIRRHEIDVRVSRVITFPCDNLTDSEQYARDQAPDNDQLMTDDLTHTIEVDSSAAKEVYLNDVSWAYFDESEPVYARFVFQDMGLEKLVNLGLCTPAGNPIDKRSQNLVAAMPLRLRKSPLTQVHGNNDDASSSNLEAVEGEDHPPKRPRHAPTLGVSQTLAYRPRLAVPDLRTEIDDNKAPDRRLKQHPRLAETKKEKCLRDSSATFTI